MTSLFGAISMGYAVIESNRLDDWRRFTEKGLGLHLECAEDDLLAFRMDAHQRRLIICQGSAEDLVALGWQVRDEATLQVLLQRLQEHQIRYEQISGAEAVLRGVQSFWRLIGPKGLPLELFTQALTTDAPLKMLTSSFVTGDGGMGHVAITSRRPEKMLRFWQEIFDARISDRITEDLAGVTLDIAFLRLNERHHSIAIAATRGVRLDPINTTVQHMNMLATTVDDLSEAYQRLRGMGYEMAHEIGQHPNDKELSFYVISPSGFEIEYGWNALTVDDEANWQPTHYHGISLWGHKPQKANLASFVSVNAGNAKRGVRSLLSSEYSPL
jgi:2,3-dihydroxybiphenyl 1,2-dioxygenase